MMNVGVHFKWQRCKVVNVHKIEMFVTTKSQSHMSFLKPHEWQWKNHKNGVMSFIQIQRGRVRSQCLKQTLQVLLKGCLCVEFYIT